MKLDERGYDCVDAFPCDVDLYVGIDIGLPTSLDACNNIPTTEFEASYNKNKEIERFKLKLFNRTKLPAMFDAFIFC